MLAQTYGSAGDKDKVLPCSTGPDAPAPTPVPTDLPRPTSRSATKERAIALLGDAVEACSNCLVFLRNDPRWSAIRQDPALRCCCGASDWTTPRWRPQALTSIRDIRPAQGSLRTEHTGRRATAAPAPAPALPINGCRATTCSACLRRRCARRIAAFRARIDDPVGLGDHVRIVLDDDHAVPAVDQAVQHARQLLDIRHVQPHRRLVQHVERVRRLSGLSGEVIAHLDQLADGLMRCASPRRVGDGWPASGINPPSSSNCGGCAMARHRGEEPDHFVDPPIFSTSPMSWPRQLTASVSAFPKRWPWQVSQGTFTSGRKLIAIIAQALAFTAVRAAPAARRRRC